MALAPALGACTPRATAADRPLEMLVPTDAETLDPRYATDAIAFRVTRLLHAGLTRLAPDTLQPVPYVAKGWTWLDARTLRVELDPAATFHSGATVRARDVAATLAAFADPRVGSRHARVVDAIGGVDVVDDATVVIHLSRTHATLLTDLELPILRADEAAGPPRADGSLDGLGPYVVGAREPGALTLVPARTAGGAPGIPAAARAVTIRTVHDENARALRVHAGRADVVVNGFSPALLPSFAGVETRDGVSVASRPGANLTYLLARVDTGALADARVRHAIAAAVDRAGIARTLLAGRASPADTLVSEGHWAFTAAPARGPGAPDAYDPDGARATLAGRAFTLLTSTDRLRGTIARTIAQELGDAGARVEVVPLELGTMIARLGAGDFELAMLQLPELAEPNTLRVFLHSSSVPPAGSNRGRVRDPEVDRLLDAGDATLDVEERRKIYAALDARVREQAWLIPLWHEDQVVVRSARAAGFLPSAEGRWLGLAALR